jgi:hypothetical protein
MRIASTALILLAIIISSCKNEDISLVGTVKITFANRPADLKVYFSPIENSDKPITGGLTPNVNGELSYELNMGNYTVNCISATFFPKVGFQVKVGKTTTIIYDSTNDGRVTN